MKKCVSSVALMFVMLVIGAAIGAAWSETARKRAEAADVKPKAPSTRSQRFGAVIGVKPEKLDEYVKLHANTWPEVLDLIRKCNIRNYSIYLGKLDDGNLYLFAYYEYTGDDFAADMKKMAADPDMRRWWKLTDPCQIPQQQRKPGEHWMTMKEVFHTD